MSFTEQDHQRQVAEFSSLKEELSRLNSQFERLLEEGKFSLEDIRQSISEPVSAELEKALAKAKEEAERAGSARAAQAAQQTPSSGKIPGAGRHGIVRL